VKKHVFGVFEKWKNGKISKVGSFEVLGHSSMIYFNKKLFFLNFNVREFSWSHKFDYSLEKIV
jgi:hypothetical protein